MIGLARASGVSQRVGDGITTTDPPAASGDGFAPRHFKKSWVRRNWCPLTLTHASIAAVNDAAP